MCRKRGIESWMPSIHMSDLTSPVPQGVVTSMSMKVPSHWLTETRIDPDASWSEHGARSTAHLQDELA